jgi:hypothetical protein
LTTALKTLNTPLVTLFSAPKSFADSHIATIQRNAIRSWTLLPETEVILLGKEEGLDEAARELGVKHFPDVARNKSGTPLISSMFQLAREHSESGALCIINTDMILMTDFIRAAQHTLKLKDRFVMLSQRWDMDIPEPIEFTEGWQDRLRSSAQGQATLHRPAGSDFFLFPLSCYAEVPDFAIGRAGWDNWMIYKARQEKWAVIDGTPSMMIIHQNHDYGHLPDSKPHYTLPETNENIRLAGGEAAIRYTILDSTHCLRDGKLVHPSMSYLRFMRGVELFLRAVFFFLPADMLENVARPKRWKKRIQKIFR